MTLPDTNLEPDHCPQDGEKLVPTEAIVAAKDATDETHALMKAVKPGANGVVLYTHEPKQPLEIIRVFPDMADLREYYAKDKGFAERIASGDPKTEYKVVTIDRTHDNGLKPQKVTLKTPISLLSPETVAAAQLGGPKL